MNSFNKITRLLAAPVIIAPILLYFLAPTAYNGAFYTFWTIMLATLIVNIPLVFLNVKQFKNALLLGWAGGRIGCLLHIFAAHGTVLPNYLIDWPPYGEGLYIITPDWFILGILLGLLVGAIIDYMRTHLHQTIKNTPV